MKKHAILYCLVNRDSSIRAAGKVRAEHLLYNLKQRVPSPATTTFLNHYQGSAPRLAGHTVFRLNAVRLQSVDSLPLWITAASVLVHFVQCSGGNLAGFSGSYAPNYNESG
jgi:hypothetical protein